MLVVADGAPGFIKAVEQCWPASDRQHCAVHRLRNLRSKLPERERERVRSAYWQALDEATDQKDGKQRLEALVDQLDRAGYTAPRNAWQTTSTHSACTCATHPPALAQHEPARTLARRSQTPHQVIGRFPGETSCLTLIWAVLDLYITHATNDIKFTQLERQPPKRMRYAVDDQTLPEEVTAA